MKRTCTETIEICAEGEQALAVLLQCKDQIFQSAVMNLTQKELIKQLNLTMAQLPKLTLPRTIEYERS